jgi:hypothetical protein
MPGRTLHQEIDTDGRSHAEPATVRRPGAPTVELALDLQRQAGNRSVTALLARRHPDADRPTNRARIGAMPAAPGTVAAMVATAARAAATRGGAASVQREPCTDCPDASAPAAPDEADGLETSSPG